MNFISSTTQFASEFEFSYRVNLSKQLPPFEKPLLPEHQSSNIEDCSGLLSIRSIRFSNLLDSLTRYSFPRICEVFGRKPLLKTYKDD